MGYIDVRGDYETMIHNPEDQWGSCMSAWFDIAAILTNRGEDVPSEWHYRPSPGPTSQEVVNDFLKDHESTALIEFGNTLKRYSRLLRAADKDY